MPNWDGIEARRQVRQYLESASNAEGAVEQAAGGITSKSRLDELDHRDRAQDIGLKKAYAKRLIWLLTAQMAFTNLVFFIYAWAGLDWRVPQNVMIAWLAATVVELIGVVTVVVHHLFPRRDA